MNFDEYARTAVDLVNAQVDTLEQVRAFYGHDSWQAAEVTEKDVAVLRKGAKRLREVFEYGSAGRDAEAVAALNLLLEAHPVQPRISFHSGNDWHMHVTSRGASVAAEHMAGAVWGLAVWLCEYGSNRFGVCADDRCGNVYLDTSSNCCRRFCSERCATRSHVAAHRARKRASADDPDRSAALRPGPTPRITPAVSEPDGDPGRPLVGAGPPAQAAAEARSLSWAPDRR